MRQAGAGVTVILLVVRSLTSGAADHVCLAVVGNWKMLIR